MAAQAGAPLHFELYTEEDDVNYIRWKWISKKEAHRVLRGMDGRLMRRSGLHDALWMDWARPEEGIRTTSVREFVLNWDDRTQFSTIGGREIPLTIDTMREYFLLPEGLNPPRSARHYDDLSDWKPLEVTWAFLYILKNKVGPADEDENLDCATYFKEKVQEEIRACKKQMQDSSFSSPEQVHVSSPSSPERVLGTSSSSPDRGHISPDPRNNPSSSSPGRTRQASPTNLDRQHSLESSPGRAPSTLSDHATRSGSPSSPDREGPADNEPLARFGSPMVPYPTSDDDEEWVIKGTRALLNLKRSDLRDQTA
ncbi:hypothetical protein R1sor_011358 [Riccia sorocarpa]|uniref:Uncharacterized protein n=1 Tax=Riccia sorocarpa TaxID=122646 RepID=A0ABD3I3E5_9MARC